MYNSDNEKLIAWTKKIMISAGLWNLPISDNRIMKITFQAYSVFMRAGFVFLWIMLFSELIRLSLGKYESATILDSLGVVVNASKAIAKLIIYLKHNVLELFNDVIQKEREIWQCNNEEIKTIYQGNIRNSKLFIIVVGGSTLLTTLAMQALGAYGVFKLIEYNEANNATLESHLMFQSFLPLNKLENLGWMFAMQIFCSWVGVCYNCATYFIFITLLIYAVSQLQILQIRLRNYVEPSFSLEANQEELDKKVNALKRIIRDHQYIIGFVNHINECTKYITMLEFILTSLALASVSTNLIKMEPSEISWLLLLFVLLFSQIMLIGWTCNEVKIQSEAIGDAIFESRWYLLNREARQLTEIVIARAQRPLLMTIGPFGPMTTNSVLTVLKAAYSYVSIMKE